MINRVHDMKTTTLKNPLRAVLSLTVLAALAACSVGPDYKRPDVDLPQSWSAAPAGALKAGGPETNSQWWKIFADPTLDKLIEEAFAKNTDIAVAAARVAEAEAELGFTRSDQFPSVTGTAGRERSRSSERSGQFQDGMPLTTTNNRAGLNVSYQIDFWGKYRRATEAARAELLATQAARDTVQISLAAQVAQGYYGLLALDAQVDAAKRAVDRGRESLDLQKKRYEGGLISEFDLRQREGEVEGVAAQLPPLERQQSAQERALAVLLGRSPREVIDVQIPRVGQRAVATSLPIAAPAGLPSDLLLGRPDLREAEQRLVAANARIGQARAAYFPSISLTGSLGSESASLSDLFSGPARTWRFAGDLTQAIWGAGRLVYQTEAAEARQQQALAQYRNSIANAFREVQDAIVAQVKAREVFDAETRRVTALSKSYELAKLRYANGMSSQLDVIDNERGLLSAEQNRIEAERGLRAAIADLYRALGTGVPVKADTKA
jgi:multidrug efflux system outer membrane protein